MKKVTFNQLIGKTFTKIIFENEDSLKNSVVNNKGSSLISFICDDGTEFSMFHYEDDDKIENYQSSVVVEDICGDIEDLLGYPILEASEVSSTYESSEEDLKNISNKLHGKPDACTDSNFLINFLSEYECTDAACCYTWTFYRLSTIKGTVTLRWLGQSNGCYSEAVYLFDITPDKESVLLN